MARKIDWNAVANEMKTFDKKGAGHGDRAVDVNLFQPKLKEDGTYDAIIRFLPAPDMDIPYAIVYNHGYQAPSGKWVIENCPKSINKKCPVCDSASKIWASGDEESARRRFKKFSAYSNILVVRDPQNPENEGKVFIFRYGKKLFEVIRNKMVPPSTLDEPLMVFDYDEGANFKLKIRSKIINDAKGNKKPVPNYDSSEFTQQSTLDEALIEEIESLLIPIKPYISEDKFLSFSELEKKVAAGDGVATADNESYTTPEAPVQKAAAPAKKAASSAASDEDFFARLRSGG
jgi:hypothetical protein